MPNSGFARSRQLANALIFKVHDAVAPLAGSTPVRRTIVDEALSYLERLEREAGADDVTLRLELAAAYRQIGGILGDPQRANLGDREGAIRQYERARAIVLPLADDRAHYDVISSLSRINGPLSTLYSMKNDQVQSLAIAREAVDHAERFRQRNTGDIRGLETLAAASFQLAWRSPRTEQAGLWKGVLEHYERLLAQQPASANYQRNVALVEKYLASMLPRDQSAPHHRRAVDLDEKRLAAAPDNRQAQLDTAISIAGLADLLEYQGNVEEAARLLERSLEIRRRLAVTDPANVQARGLLGSVLSNLARVELKRGSVSSAKSRADEGVRTLQAVLELTKDRWAQERLAHAWVELARVERAASDRAASCRAFHRAHEMYQRMPADFEPDLRNVVTREAGTCR